MTPRTLVPLFALLLTVASCGPVYQTDYSFRPPDSEIGRVCVLQCENNKLQCQQLAQMRYASCQQQADFNYQICESRRRYRYDRKGRSECIDNCYCYRTSCTENSEFCEGNYRTCYQSCGGLVSSKTYCVSNCENLGQ